MNCNIGVVIVYRKDTDLMYEFEKARALELSVCQLTVWDPSVYTDPICAEKIRAAIEKTDMKISALWAGWSGPCEWNFTAGPATIGLVPAAYRGIRVQELKNASDFAEQLGITKLITHVGFIPENPDHPDFNGTVVALRHLCKYMKAKGQEFLFETGQETPVTMLRTVQAIGYENVGINLDTANLMLYGKANPADALDVFGAYVKETHIKDGGYPTDGNFLGKETAVGKGRADFPTILRKLNALGYQGNLIIEREIKGEEQTRDIIAARDLLRGWMKEI